MTAVGRRGQAVLDRPAIEEIRSRTFGAVSTARAWSTETVTLLLNTVDDLNDQLDDCVHERLLTAARLVLRYGQSWLLPTMPEYEQTLLSVIRDQAFLDETYRGAIRYAADKLSAEDINALSAAFRLLCQHGG